MRIAEEGPLSHGDAEDKDIARAQRRWRAVPFAPRERIEPLGMLRADAVVPASPQVRS